MRISDWSSDVCSSDLEREPSAVSILNISRGGDGALEINGRAWQEDGTLSSRYWSEAMKEKQDPPGIFYFWRGERPLHPNAPQLHGTGEIKHESAERGAGYFTTLSETQLEVNAKTYGVYLHADSEDMGIFNGRDDRKRAKQIAESLKKDRKSTRLN